MINQNDSKFPWTFVTITFAFTWLVLLPGVLAHYDLLQLPFPAPALVAVAQFGPSLTAFILTYQQEGKRGAKQLLKRAVNYRLPGRWWAVVVLIPLCLGAVAFSINNILSAEAPELTMLSQPVSILPTFFMILFFYGPVPEEFGWRGYLLERLQAKWSSLVSSVVLGSIWAVWHLPAWFIDGTFQSFAPFWVFLTFNIALSVMFTWVFNNTGGNLLLALVLHTMINLTNLMFVYVGENSSGNAQIFLYLVVLYTVTALLIIRSWLPKRLTKRNVTV